MAARSNGQEAGNVPPETVQEITRELVTSRRIIAEAQGAHRAVMKRAKSLGINTKALSEVITNRALDSDEVTRHYRDVMRYAAISGAAYAIQQDLFPTSGMDIQVTDAAASEQQEWEAGDAGYEAGFNGMQIDRCPYPTASALAQMWHQSWHRGQEALARTMPPGETTPAPRPRGGRRAGPGADTNAPPPG